LKPAAIVGWTGNGELDDLERTVRNKLAGAGAPVARGSNALVISGKDPTFVARRLARLPGVDWIAVGYEFTGIEECMSRLQLLAKRYLLHGGSFKVTVRSDNGIRDEGDVLMEVTSTLLKRVKGSRVDESSPGTWFRIVMLGDRGACGVQLREGVGGVPTSKKMEAFCLVSGGYHSAVAAWMAALSGFSLTLVHSSVDDDSLRQVARLYAELSRRVDASSLKLQVLVGRSQPGDRLFSWLRRTEGEVFTGVHPECRGSSSMSLFRRFPSALLPLLLLQEKEVQSRLAALGLKGKSTDVSSSLKATGNRGSFEVKTFGGKEADLNAVLDSILVQR